MKYILTTILATILLSCAGTKSPINTNGNGYMAEGYDVTEYFNNTSVPGLDVHTAMFEGAKYKFASAENKSEFEANPSKYQPQYGGYCAYAVGADNKKIGINPESFEIRDGKLYLFYDTVFADTKKKWAEEGPERLQKQADENWKTLQSN
ncbi:YHS domain-containing (seleno)protein [Jejudonia soesokkakensis]|uniref:YHS domain-containing (Seleno)protein n=1 Tax=Jejudonia soesokkakensis TaxID=1323432 RepID=A0ABW2MS47_9FLAO